MFVCLFLQGAEVELMKAEAELKRLREQNEAYRAQIDGGGGGGRKQKVPKDDKEVPLLDPNDRSDDEEQGPSCCSRVCTFFRVNFAIIVVIAVNFVLLVSLLLACHRMCVPV